MGGMVLETNMTEILTRIEDQNKLEKAEVRSYLKIIYFVYCVYITNITLSFMSHNSIPLNFMKIHGQEYQGSY